MVRIAVTSDIHGTLPDVEPCDIFLICGDISPIHDSHSLNSQAKWFNTVFIPYLQTVKAKHIVFIAGNHDYYLYQIYMSGEEWCVREKLPKNVHYLRDSHIVLDGVSIYGTPWVNRPPWGNVDNPVWSFSSATSFDLSYRYTKDLPATAKIDIFISHSPPKGYCDLIKNLEDDGHIGSPELTEVIKRIAPKYHFFGHIHSGVHDYMQIPTMIIGESTNARNVSRLCEDYKTEYPIHYFDIENLTI